jgi:ribosome biogenesis protein BRX1
LRYVAANIAGALGAGRLLGSGTSEARSAHRALQEPHFRNKQRVLILASRGITQRYRHLMNDLRQLLPHSKKENKVEHKSKNLTLINELAEIKSCNNVIFLEVRYVCSSWFCSYYTSDLLTGKRLICMSGLERPPTVPSPSFSAIMVCLPYSIPSQLANQSRVKHCRLTLLSVHTMDELKLTGNCLQGSRPLLVFDQLFDTVPHLQLLKEIFTQVLIKGPT